MKKNRLLYLIITILIIWLVLLSVSLSNYKRSNINIVNEYQVLGISTDFTKVVDNQKEAIVSVSADAKISSGFVYKQEGNNTYIVTSYHGVADAINLRVVFASNYSTNAELIDKNIYADIAILKTNVPFEIQPLILSDVSLLKKGEFIICIGTPISLDYSESVELGLVSNVRTINNSIHVDKKDIEYYLNVIQLSSNLKPGYSGCPVLDMKGGVVGMITMSNEDNMNFAITSNEINIIADKIINGESVNRYDLGIKGEFVSNMPTYIRTSIGFDIDNTLGLYVKEIRYGSIMNLLGVNVDDIILSINDIPISDLNSYLNACYTYTNHFDVVVLRDNEQINLMADIND